MIDRLARWHQALIDFGGVVQGFTWSDKHDDIEDFLIVAGGITIVLWHNASQGHYDVDIHVAEEPHLINYTIGDSHPNYSTASMFAPRATLRMSPRGVMQSIKNVLYDNGLTSSTEITNVVNP